MMFVLLYFVTAGVLAYIALTIINILFMKLYESMVETKEDKNNKLF